ncbi:MAG: hypothetical protein IJ167_11755, partial [Lachnospiraceae bacterium]|nr:hypothetical protein [Lachnospiraceae bacterium]
MLENDNMEGKNKIDDTILNILKGNIKAEDAIREEQLESYENAYLRLSRVNLMLIIVAVAMAATIIFTAILVIIPIS